jgi:hypothetical protein
MTISLLNSNSMRPGSSETQKPPPALSALLGMGYTLTPVETLDILYADPYLPHGDYSLRELADGGRYDVILSGPDTMLSPGKYPRPPVGPVFRNGGLDTEGTTAASNRGAVAIVNDGTIILGRTQGTSAGELKAHFGQPGNPLVSAVGGGALLIENGRMVDDRDLMLIQGFGGSPPGLRSYGMQSGVHTIMGIRKGRAYAAWCTSKSGLDIRNDFHLFDFGCVIKFAHGSSVFFDDCVDRLNGQNATGFGVTRAY